jgi:hypothetical protein
MFKACYNISFSFIVSIHFMILTIITGKMSKISPYHFETNDHDNGVLDVCSDKYKQTHLPSNVSVACKELIINDFLTKLARYPKFDTQVGRINFPIFDGQEIIGTQGYYTVIQDCLKDYLKDLKINDPKAKS